jgi:glutaredoxin-like protein
MSLLREKDRQVIRERLRSMVNPVKLVHFTQSLECESCGPTLKLLRELTSLSDKLSLEELNLVLDRERARQYGVDKAPATVVVGARDNGVRIYGLPAGFEFPVLLEAILDASGRPSQLSSETLARLAQLNRPVHLEVFTSPTCPYCPAAARLAHQLAMASDWITADMVEASEYMDLALKYRVRGVPKTMINGSVGIEGAVPEEYLVEQILQAAGVAPAAAAHSLEA